MVCLKLVGEVFVMQTITRDVQYVVDREELCEITESYLQGQNPYQDLEGFLKAAFLASHDLPAELRSALYDFRAHGNSEGYFLIRSLPCDENLMNTPEKITDPSQKKQTFVSEFCLAMIGGFLGHPFSYIQENCGNFFHNIRPQKEKADKISSESSKILLDLHSETAFHPLYPDWLLLYCLRGDRDKQAKTIIASIAHIKDQISPQLDAVLRQPLFKTGIDYSFGNISQDRGNGPVIPILYGDKDDPLLIFDPDLMIGLTPEASCAITELKNLLDSKKDGVLLESGDLLVVDNHRSLHGRNKFTPYYDGKDRWLQRIYVAESLLRASRLFGKKERTITYTFSD